MSGGSNKTQKTCQWQLWVRPLITPDISPGWGQPEGKCALHILFSQEHSRHPVKSLGLAPQSKQRRIKKIHEHRHWPFALISNGKPYGRQEPFGADLVSSDQRQFRTCMCVFKLNASRSWIFQVSEILTECYRKKLFGQNGTAFQYTYLRVHIFEWPETLKTLKTF